MSEPLDFSKVGAKKPAAGAPPPRAPKKAPRRSSGTAPRRRAPVAVLALVAVVAVAVGAYLVAGRKGGGGAGAANEAAAQARFCELALTLDRLAPDRPDGLPPAEAKSALDQLGATSQELRSLAPGKVDGDVSAALSSLRAAAGGDAKAVQSAAYHGHRQKISRYTSQQCSLGVGGGDQ